MGDHQFLLRLFRLAGQGLGRGHRGRGWQDEMPGSCWERARPAHHVLCRGDLRSPFPAPYSQQPLRRRDLANRSAPARGRDEPTGATAGRPYTKSCRPAPMPRPSTPNSSASRRRLTLPPGLVNRQRFVVARHPILSESKCQKVKMPVLNAHNERSRYPRQRCSPCSRSRR